MMLEYKVSARRIDSHGSSIPTATSIRLGSRRGISDSCDWAVSGSDCIKARKVA